MIVNIGLCLLILNYVFISLAIISLAIGVFSFFRPKSSVNLYIWIMSKFNWKVCPIDDLKEERNTRKFGICLMVLGIALITAVIFFS